ncbi:MAG: protein tyrosine phosphatase [Verrucomicrobia bacterium]|nr:protein tyrosine phosphatase [Verrucomicrobiota bacterium]
MGAGLLQHALAAQPEPLRSVRVVSAGVAAHDGERVSENSIIALRKAGIDISHHRSRTLSEAMLAQAIAVLCMTESHRSMIQLQAETPPKDVFLFREFMPGHVSREICDPFGGPLKAYETARDEMVEAIPALVEFLKTRVAPGRSR